ncbi:MAG: hypothetical protein RSC84_05990 [Peptostreptococcaceae bacterium]
MKYKLNTQLIKQEMLQKGYSINRLAKESNILRLLNQQGTSRPETIYKIATSLDLQVKDILL